MDKIKTLQPKNACGVDGIFNEMIKYTDSKFQLAILKLFNIILSSGIFPNIWIQGLITPIHKSGDKFDPNGICVNRNLGKILCIIINSRLVHFLSENNVLSKCEIGYLPNYHTTDHVFTLHTLIDNQTKQNKSKVFSCCHALTLEILFVLYVWLGQGVTRVGKSVFYFFVFGRVCGSQSEAAVYRCL